MKVVLRDEASGKEYEFEHGSGEVLWDDKHDGFTELPLKTDSGDALPGSIAFPFILLLALCFLNVSYVSDLTNSSLYFLLVLFMFLHVVLILSLTAFTHTLLKIQPPYISNFGFINI